VASEVHKSTGLMASEVH